MMQPINEQLRQARIDAGLTLRQAAEKIGVGFTYIGRIECGQHQPRLDLLQKIADVYGLSVTLTKK